MGLGASPAPVMYIPYRQFALPLMQLLVRADAGPGAVRALVQARLHSLDADLPLGETRALGDVVAGQTAEPRFRATLLLTFAGLALVLAAVGLYGLIGYTVANRKREIGIRVALGATARQVVGPIVREGLTLGALGIAIGLAASLAATRVLAAFLFGVTATDPLTFAGVAGLLLAVAFAASVVPARRALKVDPVTALRAE
jgi:ABC-type antimicrobial peptide transport system permease subunit